MSNLLLLARSIFYDTKTNSFRTIHKREDAGFQIGYIVLPIADATHHYMPKCIANAAVGNALHSDAVLRRIGVQ